MQCYSFEEWCPIVSPRAFVHPTAVLIGDVSVDEGCYIGPFACLRGDFGRITIERGANIQDHCLVHTFPGAECRVESAGHVGHGAILHGCTVKRNALVGIQSVIMDDATIGEEAIVGAQSFVKSGFFVPARALAFGNPVKVVRQLTAEEIEWKSRGTLEYQELAARCLVGLRDAKPLTQQAIRPPRTVPSHVPLHRARRPSGKDNA